MQTLPYLQLITNCAVSSISINKKMGDPIQYYSWNGMEPCSHEFLSPYKRTLTWNFIQKDCVMIINIPAYSSSVLTVLLPSRYSSSVPSIKDLWFTDLRFDLGSIAVAKILWALHVVAKLYPKYSALKLKKWGAGVDTFGTWLVYLLFPFFFLSSF